jgi:hypothetical protein
MPELSPEYAELRELMLARAPGSETQPTEELPRVYGVLVDIGFDLMFTIATYADGTTSACAGNGVGVNGMGNSMETLVLGRAILRGADTNLAMFEPIDSAPLPAFGRVRFTALTYDGRFGLEVDGPALLKGQSPLSAPFQAVMAIMEQARNEVIQARADGDSTGVAPD